MQGEMTAEWNKFVKLITQTASWRYNNEEIIRGEDI